MTKREFATLIFRVLGVYCLIGAVSASQPLGMAMLSLFTVIGNPFGPVEWEMVAALAFGCLLQLTLGVFLFFRASHLAVTTVGPEAGTVVIEPTSGRYLILWGIGLFLLATNVPQCAAKLGTLALSGYPGASPYPGFLNDTFQPFARTLIGLYMFRIGSGHLVRWSPPRVEDIPHPRDWGRDPDWQKEEIHDQT